MNRQSKTSQAEGLLPNQIKLLHMLRRFWAEHALWTRSYLISAVNELNDLTAVSERLLRNPKDFSTIFSALYGDTVAYGLETLLTDHSLIAIQVMAAAKRGDEETVAQLRNRWYENAGKLADFLGGINPHWSGDAWRTMLEEHLEMTEDQIAHVLAGRAEDGIARFEAALELSFRMGDEMAGGIFKQFKI